MELCGYSTSTSVPTLLGSQRPLLSQPLENKEEKHLWSTVLQKDFFAWLPSSALLRFYHQGYTPLHLSFCKPLMAPAAFDSSQLLLFQQRLLFSIPGHFVARWLRTPAGDRPHLAMLPIHLAILSNAGRLLPLLLHAEASFQLTALFPQHRFSTVHLAVFAGRPQMLALLLSLQRPCGLDLLSLADDAHRSPLALAAALGKKACYEVLQSYATPDQIAECPFPRLKDDSPALLRDDIDPHDSNGSLNLSTLSSSSSSSSSASSSTQFTNESLNLSDDQPVDPHDTASREELVRLQQLVATLTSQSQKDQWVIRELLGELDRQKVENAALRTHQEGESSRLVQALQKIEQMNKKQMDPEVADNLMIANTQLKQKILQVTESSNQRAQVLEASLQDVQSRLSGKERDLADAQDLHQAVSEEKAQLLADFDRINVKYEQLQAKYEVLSENSQQTTQELQSCQAQLKIRTRYDASLESHISNELDLLIQWFEMFQALQRSNSTFSLPPQISQLVPSRLQNLRTLKQYFEEIRTSYISARQELHS